MKPSRSSLLIYTLVGVIVVLIGYIAYDKVILAYNQKVNTALNQGYQAGAADAIRAMFQQTNECRIATLNLGNETRNLADVECMQQALQQAQSNQPSSQSSSK